jgi:hypothetical protein
MSSCLNVYPAGITQRECCKRFKIPGSCCPKAIHPSDDSAIAINEFTLFHLIAKSGRAGRRLHTSIPGFVLSRPGCPSNRECSETAPFGTFQEDRSIQT